MEDNTDWKAVVSGGGFWVKLGEVVGVLLVLAILLLIGFRMLFVDYVEQYEQPYKFDRMTGEVTILPKTGYIVTPPFVVKVYGIDLRPHQIMIDVGDKHTDSANKRVLNAKLVQFNPAGIKQFIAWHGLQEGDVSEILKIYAYDQQGRNFPFLLVDSQTSSVMPLSMKP